MMAGALAPSGLPPHSLELEITESVLINHDTDFTFQIDAIHDLGVCITMHDFATGLSSLG